MRSLVTDIRTSLPFNPGFSAKAIMLLGLSAMILYLVFGATYPPVHDLVHDFRHSLAIVPCH
jgi:cobalt transporter subunit CbtB